MVDERYEAELVAEKLTNITCRRHMMSAWFFVRLAERSYAAGGATGDNWSRDALRFSPDPLKSEHSFHGTHPNIVPFPTIAKFIVNNKTTLAAAVLKILVRDIQIV